MFTTEVQDGRISIHPGCIVYTVGGNVLDETVSDRVRCMVAHENQ